MRIAAQIACLLIAFATAASAQLESRPDDVAAVAAACGAEVTIAQLKAMPRAQAEARIACFQREAAKRVNLQLPSKIDAVTTLESVTTEGPILTYHFKIDLLSANIAPANLDTFKSNVRTKVCGTQSMVQTIQAGGSYRYLWKDRNDTRFAELFVSAC